MPGTRSHDVGDDVMGLRRETEKVRCPFDPALIGSLNTSSRHELPCPYVAGEGGSGCLVDCPVLHGFPKRLEL